MRSSKQRKVIPVRLSDEEIRHCEKQGNGNRSEYIRSLVQREMGGEDSLTEKIKAILFEMNLSSLPNSSYSPSSQSSTVSESDVSEVSPKPVHKKAKTQEPEEDQITSQVRSSIKDMLFKV